ncbi:MAG TPA: protein kinase [Gemmatimonadales bacterium]|nr:protein kinase [Gemmatimonadales bacterium]
MADAFDRLKAALAGRYALAREIGAGGMATVYLAEDLRHRRKVAVKVLRRELAASLGSERFIREIEIAAQLQHPHILPVLDSGEADGFLYYVMPFVDGESLRARLARQGELPIPEAVRLLGEIADALAYAHAHGVVHRDIKPDNVLLSGRHVLVTDFGVAKAVTEATGRHELTTAGVAIGTPAYMAPEQATADPHVDHRADIYALGVLGYELVAGGTPFAGTPQAVLAAQVTQDPPPVTAHRPSVPAPLAEVIMRCLAKHPADRWQTAQEVVERLEQIATPSTGTTPTDTRLVAAARRPRPALIGGVVGAAAALIAVAVVALRHETPARLVLGRAAQLTFDEGLELDPAISPDGKFVAYAKGPPAAMRLFIRQIGGGQPIALTQDSGPSQRQPRWSPDGSRILFQAGDSVYLIPALGGSPRLVAQGISQARGPRVGYFTTKAWAPDGQRFLFTRGDTALVQDLGGGSPRTMAVLPVRDAHSFAWSPDGALVAFAAGNSIFTLGSTSLGNVGPGGLWVIRADGGAPLRIAEPTALNTSPAWSPDSRHLLFVSNRDGPRDVYRVRITRDGVPDGAVERVTQGLNAHSVSQSADGHRLAYSLFVMRANIWVADLPAGGGPADSSHIRPVTEGSQLVEAMSLSADGRWLYFDSNFSGNQDLYRMPSGGGELQQLTSDPGDDFYANPSPDGREIAFHAVRRGTRDIIVMPAGGGPETVVYAGPHEDRYAHWSPDGRLISFTVTEAPPDRVGLYVTRRQADGSWGSPKRVSPREVEGRWTPDGALLLEEGFNESARDLVRHLELVDVESGAVKPVPVPLESAVHISAMPSADGRALYLRTAGLDGSVSFWTMAVSGGQVRLLLRVGRPNWVSSRGNWATDGKRLFFAVNERESDIYVAEVSEQR